MKQKQSNISKILVSLILILFLLILISSQVYAWFSARARYENTPTFATLEVDITSGSTSMTDSSFTTIYLNNVYQGSTINFNSLSILNTGNEAVYAIFDNRPFDGRFYYMHIWDNDNESMLIPVLDSNGVVCVYDTINQQFYYSENEDTFGYSL